MILVDTTVWIDFFNNRGGPHVDKLARAVEEEDIAICGVVEMEVLQGIREEGQFHEIKNIIADFIYLPTDRSTFHYAANIYRTCRKHGITIRKPIDCLIAAVCIENTAFLHHNDRDFVAVSRNFPLQFY
jgi:predicted nucleic acid-binding protein